MAEVDKDESAYVEPFVHSFDLNRRRANSAVAKSLVYSVRSGLVASVLEAIWTRKFFVVLGHSLASHSSSPLVGEFIVGKHDTYLDRTPGINVDR